MPSKPLTGRVPPDAIRLLSLPRLDPGLLRRYAALEDLSGAVSMRWTSSGSKARCRRRRWRPRCPAAAWSARPSRCATCRAPTASPRLPPAARGMMGEHEAYNLAEPGDVVVIEGLPGVSNLGGQSAAVASRSGCAGAIVDGGHRDPDASRELGPIWSRGPTPITGKWRLRTAEINGTVHIASMPVQAGDLVVADDAGVVFVPHAQALAVLEAAERVHAGDARQKADIARGVDPATLAATRYK